MREVSAHTPRGSADCRDSCCITIARSAYQTGPARLDAEQSRPICSAANSQAPCQRRRRARAAPEIASAHPRGVRDAPCASKQCYATPVPDSPNIRRRRACAENWPAAPSSRTTKIVPWLMGSGAAQVREANTFRRGNRREAISEAVLVGVAGFEPATPSSRTRMPGAKYLKNRELQERKPMNGTRTFAYFCAVPVPRPLSFS